MNELKVATDTQGFKSSQEIKDYVAKTQNPNTIERLECLEKAIDKLQQLNFKVSVPNIVLMMKKLGLEMSEIGIRQSPHYNGYVILRKNEPPRTTPTTQAPFNQPFKVLTNLNTTTNEPLSEQFRKSIQPHMRPDTWVKLEPFYKTIDTLHKKSHLGKWSILDYVKHLKETHNVYLASSMISGNRLIKEAFRLRVCENMGVKTTIQVDSKTYNNQHDRKEYMKTRKKAKLKGIEEKQAISNLSLDETPTPKTTKNNSLVDDITKVISMGLDENLTTEVIKSLVKKNKGV